MSNKIELKPISNLLGMNFFIPSYQRGYRWEEQQVKDLLNDISAFAIIKNKSDKEFYCLQPIVVKSLQPEEIKRKELKSSLNNNQWYEVIDGQQRLTTIRILISYLIKKHLTEGETLQNAYGKPELVLDYETRPGTRDFLENLTKYGKIEDENINNENIDFYYISEAYKQIANWFEKKDQQKDERESIIRTLVHDMQTKKPEGIIQVIWYEINEKNNNPIDTFTRINMGKIPLTNSELVKALFLQKRNFNDVTADLRQIEISNEWDRMEYALQNDDFWWFLNKEENEIPARIEFLFDMMCDVEKKNDRTLQDRIGSDNYATFRFFNEKFSDSINIGNVTDVWNDVKDYFLAFEEWFNEPIWYHYIGYLIYCGIPVIDIYKTYEGSSKIKFEEDLIFQIKKNLSVYYSKQETGLHVVYAIDRSYDNKKEDLRKFLLLYNIEYIVNQYRNAKDKSNEIFIRFPFELFKKEKWNIEHVNSFTENTLSDKNTQNEWLEMQKRDFHSDIKDEIKQKIDDFLVRTDTNSFEDLKKEILEIIETNSVSEEGKNGIGNFTLLDEETNKSYGNSLFPVKRRIIIEKDRTGKFIPICTKNVFLKSFDTKGTSRTHWTEEDIANYQNHIGNTLENFLTLKKENNNG